MSAHLKYAVAKNQIVNNAGGVVYRADEKSMVERFLHLGVVGGTYYVGEAELAKQVLSKVTEIIKSKPQMVFDVLKDAVVNRKVWRQNHATTLLALLAVHGTPEVRSKIHADFNILVPSASHLFSFAKAVTTLKGRPFGWSRYDRKLIATWYAQPWGNLVYQLLKYRTREGWAHRDILRMGHVPKSENSPLLAWAAHPDVFEAPDSGIKAFEDLQKVSSFEEATEILERPEAQKFTWEMVPNTLLAAGSKMWGYLVSRLPATALLRNLNKFSFDEDKTLLPKVVARLKEIKAHPFALMLAYNTYTQGTGTLGSLTWKVAPAVSKALEDAVYRNLETEVSGKKVLFAIDISGSMCCLDPKMNASYAGIARAITRCLAPGYNSTIVGIDSYVDTKETPTLVTWGLKDLLTRSTRGGATYLHEVFKWIGQEEYDAIVFLTDSETYSQSYYGGDMVNSYKKHSHEHPNCKYICVAMAANENTCFDPLRPTSLNIAGFDGSIAELVHRFIED